MILYLTCLVTYLTDGFIETNLFPDNGNIWEYLVREVLNTTDFCLKGGRSVKDILSTCLIGVAAHPQSIQNFTKLRNFHLTTSYSTIFYWGRTTDFKDETMFVLHTTTVTSAAMYFKMEGCVAPRVLDCQDLSNMTLSCNHTKTIPFAYNHVKLPLGWFILCSTKSLFLPPC